MSVCFVVNVDVAPKLEQFLERRLVTSVHVWTDDGEPCDDFDILVKGSVVEYTVPQKPGVRVMADMTDRFLQLAAAREPADRPPCLHVDRWRRLGDVYLRFNRPGRFAVTYVGGSPYDSETIGPI